jgi:hypothetical protein
VYFYHIHPVAYAYTCIRRMELENLLETGHIAADVVDVGGVLIVQPVILALHPSLVNEHSGISIQAYNSSNTHTHVYTYTDMDDNIKRMGR